MLYDTDWGFGYTGSAAQSLNLLDKAARTGSVGIIFGGLMKNGTFREQFKARFRHHLDTTFSKEVVMKKIDAFEAALAPYMQEHIDRWRAIGSYESWKENVQELRDFEKERSNVQPVQLDEFLKRYN